MDKVQLNLIMRALAQHPDQQSRFAKEANSLQDSEISPFLAKFYERQRIDPASMHAEARRILDKKISNYRESHKIQEKLRSQVSELEQQIMLRKNTLKNLLLP